MQQLQKTKIQPLWVVQTKTLRYFQQTAEVCVPYKFETKYYKGDRVPVPPKYFSKFNNLLNHHYLTESLEILDSQGCLGESELFFISYLPDGGEV